MTDDLAKAIATADIGVSVKCHTCGHRGCKSVDGYCTNPDCFCRCIVQLSYIDGDYGEPWARDPHTNVIVDRHGQRITGQMLNHIDRLLVCINACALKSEPVTVDLGALEAYKAKVREAAAEWVEAADCWATTMTDKAYDRYREAEDALDAALALLTPEATK